MNDEEIRILALKMRKKILEISLACNNSAHLGGGLSLVEILATLYGSVMKYDVNNPEWEFRDRFILSKGHGVLPFYASLYFTGFINDDVMNTFKKNESDLISHPVMNLPLGIESSNGSLGHGLSMGVGIAIASKIKSRSNKVYVVMGDGECNEGSVWEAAMSAAHFKLDNLVAVLDYNKLQSDGRSEDIMDIGNLYQKWESFGWDVINVDGHNISELLLNLTKVSSNSKPRILIANTIKGKGVSFMENNNTWHHNRLTQNIYDQAISELQDLI
jgi:transketolase